jgi:hydrogenase nickel incorporation protein HypB
MGSNGKKERIQIVTKVLKANDRVAEQNKKRFAGAGVTAVDIMGSPGSGKTALLEATIPLLVPDIRVGVIEGDISTSRDAERIAAFGVPVVQITTESFGGSCHLEASTVGQALDELPLEDIDLLIIENVGNLVCPAEFDIGQHARVLVSSITEGEDKPLKYPLAFREADIVIFNKIDLIPYLNPDMDALRGNLEKVHPNVPSIELSAREKTGLEPWISWIRSTIQAA